MAYELNLKIEGLPKATANANQHWKARWVEAKKWKGLVFWEIDATKRPRKPLDKARVTLTRCAHGRKPDRDNLITSFKHVIDALVEAQVLLDDNQDVITEINYHWEPASPGQGCILIKVEEL
jgi:Holliday junction resolvase RusA-like endonuclease